MKADVLYNPFRYIAGGKSLIIGIITLLIASWLGRWNNLHFDGVIDIHIGAKAPDWFFYAETFLSWFIISMLLYLASFIISKTKVRIIDIFGTQAMAKIPLIVVAIISFIPQFHFQINANGLPKIDIWLIIYGFITIIFTIWIIALMYNAYSLSANIKGAKAIISFIVTLIIAEAISKYTIIKLFLLTK
jgi:hypothetical protein